MLARLLAVTAALSSTLLLPATAGPTAETPARAGDSAVTGHRAPALFAPGVISTPDQEEYRITFTPDGRTAYFSRAASFFPVSRQATIYQSQRTRTGWSTPVVAPFSGTYSDIDPFVTPDGKHLYFSSIRPVGGTARDDIDVWVVDRRPDGSWSAPRHTGAVNQGGVAADGSPIDELYPSIGPDGAMYVGSNRDGGQGGWDVWRAAPRRDGTFGPAVNLGPKLNTAGWEFNPVVSPDGRYLVFSRIAAFQAPWGELQASARTAHGWGAPHPIEAVNTEADEYHASFSPDGRRFYFVRNAVTETSNGDFYTIPVRNLRLGR
ncbi:WD40 domain protein beta Propeller [Kribbella flavida DSM 17836]|uniref:WD40 domain protein beta Propeller n=1 Tax=Kribbella flavida (strain DSM 17836 / JCM 10339 / NBRC 14399) TaxID=479435 RepID=D2PNH7_KRIFD|nr:PD40 domain-containing protein [Kribbella flavida]ADB30829.1 WD40 domain protein beta Propeller [Kribbella flavida DSM 17836]